MDTGAEERYSISEIAKMLGIEQSVLRSTEKQLGLEIPRSEGNRRYYRESEVTLLKDVQKLREEGFTFRMIKLLLPNLSEVLELKTEERRNLRLRMKKILVDMQAEEEEEEEDTSIARVPSGELAGETKEKEQAYTVFGTVMTELLKQNNKALLKEMDAKIAQRIMKEMNYLFRERESLEEERYRRLDRTIRECQAARQQTAMEEERRRLFRKGFW